AGGAHGIVMHATAALRDVAIELFGGDGIHICASLGFTPKSGADCWQIYNCQVNLCRRHGLYVHGDESQAGCAIALICQDTSGWGILDESWEGNTYVACLVENGAPAAGGYRAAQAMPADQAHPQPVNRGSGSVFLGCYLEGAIAEIETPNAVIGGRLGNLGNQPPNSGMLLSHATGAAVFPNSVAGGNYSPSTSGKQVFGSLGGSSNAEDTALELWRDGYNNTAGSVYRLTYASRKNPATSADSATGWWELKLNNRTGSILAFSTDEAEPEVGPNVLWFSAGF